MDEKKSTNDSASYIPGFLKLRKNQFFITFGLMIVFALLGFVIGKFYKFEYEAEAVLITNLELVEDTNITEMMVDSQLELIRQLMYTDEITERVIAIENQSGNSITLDQLKRMSVVERRLNSTLIKVRDYNPLIATRIANNWIKATYERLSIAYEHAVLVSEAKWMLTSIEDCLTDEKLVDVGFCKNLSPEKVRVYTQQAQQTILRESPLSLGLTKDIQISQYQLADTPTRPVQGKSSNFMFIGSLAGIVVSMIMYELPAMKNRTEAE